MAGPEHLDPAFVAGYDRKAGDSAQRDAAALPGLGLPQGATRPREAPSRSSSRTLLSYEHRGEPAQLVYSRNALHHLPDFWKAVALRRIASVLRPGGLLRLRDIVFSFDPDESQVFIDRWLAAAPDRGEDGWTRAELEAHLRTEYSTFTWLLEPMLERCGFTIREARYSDTRTFADYLRERAIGVSR